MEYEEIKTCKSNRRNIKNLAIRFVFSDIYKAVYYISPKMVISINNKLFVLSLPFMEGGVLSRCFASLAIDMVDQFLSYLKSIYLFNFSQDLRFSSLIL